MSAIGAVKLHPADLQLLIWLVSIAEVLLEGLRAADSGISVAPGDLLPLVRDLRKRLLAPSVYVREDKS